MGALGHYLEEEGVATTQISLVREHTAAMCPPRALWVPFILGRPLGVPDNSGFQRRVLYAALRLLEAESGPVLEDFPEDAPSSTGGEEEAFVCPVNFSRHIDAEDLASAWQAEVSELATWHDLAGAIGSSAQAGTSGMTPARAAQFVANFIADPSLPSYHQELALVPALRLVCHDIKEFYLRAVAAQPGARAAVEVQRWFWNDTVAGKALLKLREVCLKSDDEMLRRLGATGIVPRAVAP